MPALTIAPSILNADFLYLKKDLDALTDAGIHSLHLDIMDGNFVPNLSFGPALVAAVSGAYNFFLDAHLMLQHPQQYVDVFADAGAHQITVHQEVCPHLDSVLRQIKQRGCKAGVALNPATSIHTLDPFLHTLDTVLIMSVNPGFGGQSLIPYCLDKIRQLHSLKQQKEYSFQIAIDGGVNEKNICKLPPIGVNYAVIGSFLFDQKQSIAQKITSLHQLL